MSRPGWVCKSHLRSLIACGAICAVVRIIVAGEGYFPPYGGYSKSLYTYIITLYPALQLPSRTAT